MILRRDKAIHPQGTFETVATNTATADTAYVDLNVRAGRRYVYRIQAINPAGTSDRSSWARAYTPGPRPSPQRPARPTGLSSQASHDTVTLSWDDPGDPAVSGYVILRRDKDIHNRGTFHTINPDTGDADTTYTDATAEPERRYIYRIKAINTAGYSKTSAYHRTDTPPEPEPAPEPDPTQDTTDTDPAADTDTADLDTDTHPDDNDPDPAADPDTADLDSDTDPAETETTSSPPPETPEWLRGFVTTRTHTEDDPDALAEPTRFRAQVGSVDILINLRWSPVSDADGYKVYVLATRGKNSDGTDRAWWVDPEEDSGINIMGPYKSGSAVLTQVSRQDTPPGISDHVIIALVAYRDTDWGGKEWSHWRIAAVEHESRTLSYDLYDEGITDF